MILYSKELLLNNKKLPKGTILYSSTTPGQETSIAIPAGVKSIYFELVGGAGLSYSNSGGAGGKVTGYMKVSKGLVLHLVTAYAWNNNYTPVYNASDLRLPSLSANWWEQRIATAGGGGCGSTRSYGGIGGYNATDGGQRQGGKHGTQTANGAGGTSSHSGNPGGSYAVGHGGAGITRSSGNNSGAGGAGWYPGGSGGVKDKGGIENGYGGGGGASNINPNYIYDVQYFDGVNTGTGSVLVTVNS